MKTVPKPTKNVITPTTTVRVIPAFKGRNQPKKTATGAKLTARRPKPIAIGLANPGAGSFAVSRDSSSARSPEVIARMVSLIIELDSGWG